MTEGLYETLRMDPRYSVSISVVVSKLKALSHSGRSHRYNCLRFVSFDG